MTSFKQVKRPKQEDPSPHSITLEERAYIDERLVSGGLPRAHLVRKMLRLYDERTAACIQLMKIRKIDESSTY